MSDNEGNGELGQLRAENARRRLQAQKLKADLAAAQALVASLTAERDGLKSSAPSEAEVSEAQAEIDQLRGQLRMSRHRDGLKELAYSDEIGVSKSVPIDKLITLSGYKADGDEFDPKAAGKMLEGLKKTDPYLFGTSAPEAEAQPSGPDQSHLWRAVQQRGEGGGVTTKAGSITREQARDAAFVMNQAAERRREAARGK